MFKIKLKKAGNKAEKWEEEIDDLVNNYNINNTDIEKEKILKKLDIIFKDIKNSRRENFSSGGDELSPDNITFKMLRRNGSIDKISKTKNKIYNNLMSINEK